MTYHGNKKIKCNFLDCAAGDGAAGRGVCVLNGDWSNPDCDKGMTDEEFKKWLKKEMQMEKTVNCKICRGPKAKGKKCKCQKTKGEKA